MEPRIYTHYKHVVCQDMIYTCAIKNTAQLPQITQCVLNASSPNFSKKNSGLAAQIALQSLGGQKALTTRAHKSIAPFQLRENQLLGCKTNLRGRTLYYFLDQYVHLVCPSLSAGSTFADFGNQKKKKRRTSKSVAQQFSQNARSTTVDYNVAGDNFLVFPGLQSHFLAFLNTGGFNCTFSALVKDRGQQTAKQLLSALEIPSFR